MMRWLQITSGRGPDECRWVVFQLVQYLMKKASRNSLRMEILDATPGRYPETYSSVLVSLEGGESVSPFISEWKGTIQWVGTSIFRPKHKRKNWFVTVAEIEQMQKENWKTEDISIERMRSSGPGGQHANKTETAIRVTHLPTGLSAVSQEERSQHFNKRLALHRLQELMTQRENQARKDFEAKCWSGHNQVERGNAVQVFTGKKFKLKKG